LIRPILAPTILALTLAGCVRYPEPYAPPTQRLPLDVDAPERLKHFIAMSDPLAPRHIVSGVLPELHDDSWRWTLQNPVFRFHLPTTLGLTLQADLTVPDASFQQTGPVRITVWVETHQLAVIEFKKPDKILWRKEVPAAWLPTDQPVQVNMQIDKMMRSGDKAWGFIVTSIGFTQ
jgi:hypothetical protein